MTQQRGTVNCNSDEVVTGGGFEFNQFGNTVSRDHKSGNGWKFQAFNSGDAQQAFVYADCAHLELGP